MTRIKFGGGAHIDYQSAVAQQFFRLLHRDKGQPLQEHKRGYNQGGDQEKSPVHVVAAERQDGSSSKLERLEYCR